MELTKIVIIGFLVAGGFLCFISLITRRKEPALAAVTMALGLVLSLGIILISRVP